MRKKAGRKRGTKNLTKDQQMFILNMLARFKSNREISELFHHVHGQEVTNYAIDAYRKDASHKATISKLRDKYLAGVMEVPIAQKRVRLERHEDLYREAMVIDKAKDRIDASVKVLQAARDEIEGKSITQFNQFTQHNEFVGVSNEELLRRQKEIAMEIARIKTIDVEAEDATHKSG